MTIYLRKILIDCQSELMFNLKLLNLRCSVYTFRLFALLLSTKKRSRAKPNDNETRISVFWYLLPESTVIQVITEKSLNFGDANHHHHHRRFTSFFPYQEGFDEISSFHKSLSKAWFF